MAFARRAVLRDGHRLWSLRSGGTRGCTDGRRLGTEARPSQHRRTGAVPLLVAPRISPLWVHARLASSLSRAPSRLASPQLAQPVLASSLLPPPSLCVSPPLLLQFLSQAVLSSSLRLLHRLVLVVRSNDATKQRRGCLSGVFDLGAPAGGRVRPQRSLAVPIAEIRRLVVSDLC